MQYHCCILDILDKTGVSGKRFSVALSGHGREYSMPLEVRKNDRANLLQDTNLMAIYAIINEFCLEYHTQGHFTGICNSISACTGLETQISLGSSQSLRGSVWLGQQGSLNIVSEKDDSMIFVAWESGSIKRIKKALGKIIGSDSSRTMNCEVSDQSEPHHRKVHVFVRSHDSSYGGLARPRKKCNLLDHNLSTSD